MAPHHRLGRRDHQAPGKAWDQGRPDRCPGSDPPRKWTADGVDRYAPEIVADFRAGGEVKITSLAKGPKEAVELDDLRKTRPPRPWRFARPGRPGRAFRRVWARQTSRAGSGSVSRQRWGHEERVSVDGARGPPDVFVTAVANL